MPGDRSGELFRTERLDDGGKVLKACQSCRANLEHDRQMGAVFGTSTESGELSWKTQRTSLLPVLMSMWNVLIMVSRTLSA